MRGKYRVYWASRPPREDMARDQLDRLIPAEFSTEEDALHAAALVLRAKKHVWCIEPPDGPPMTAADVLQKVSPLLDLMKPQLP